MEASIASLLRSFRGSLCYFLAGGTSSQEKHLENFFKFLSQGGCRLVRDLVQSQKSHVLHNKGLFQNRFQKLFIFPLHLVTIHLLVCLFLFQKHHVQTKILHIVLHLFTNLQEKVWVLFLSQYISHLFSYISWIMCFC